MKLPILLLTFLIVSCGAKTINKEETKTDSTAIEKERLELVEAEKLKADATIKEQSNSSSTNTQFDFSNGFNFESQDPTKPSSITDSKGNTTTFQNAKGSTITKTKIVIQKDTVAESKVSELKIEISRNKTLILEKDKEIRKLQNDLKLAKEKKQYSIFSDFWFWLLLLILLLAGYIFYKWQKGTNPISLVGGLFGK
jgi:hypothetical protein